MLPHKLVHRFNGCGYYAGQITISTAQRKAVTIKLPPFLLHLFGLFNINAVRQSRVYHFLLFCKHFGGVDRCNIIEHIKPSEIA